MKDFRMELEKHLPGYKWTVHRAVSKQARVVSATGIQSSGFNRLSTIEVTRQTEGPWYEVAGFGYGLKGAVMGRGCGGTLARAVRELQNCYRSQKETYTYLERALEEARGKKNTAIANAKQEGGN